MISFCFLFFVVASTYCRGYTFPDSFRFGISSSTNQLEGIRYDNGRENIIDELTQIKQDVQLLHNLGVNFYRFSISWSRILPNGKTNNIDSNGIQFYNQLINELLENNITPLVLMFQNDLPQQLSDLGGFLNLEIADYFKDYANILFDNFGDRIKEWITFNEANVFCYWGYEKEQPASVHHQNETNRYLCSRTLLIAHANVYHLYNKKYRSNQKGRIGICNNIVWFEPLTETIKDLRAADAALEYFFGWFVNPIFSKDGDYPQVMKGSIEYESKIQGYASSKLPDLTDEEIRTIRGSADFLAVNHYTTYYCTPISEEMDEVNPEVFHFTDMDATCRPDPNTKDSNSITPSNNRPFGFRKSLKWIRDQYNNPEVMITENGVVNSSNLINDCERVSYHNSHLSELLKTIHEDGCNVTGYAAWNFLDTIEWKSGFVERSGLYTVDFNDPQRRRTPKMSAYIYKNIIINRNINWTYTPLGFSKCEWLIPKYEL